MSCYVPPVPTWEDVFGKNRTMGERADAAVYSIIYGVVHVWVSITSLFSNE